MMDSAKFSLGSVLLCSVSLLFAGCDALRSLTETEEDSADAVVDSDPSLPPEAGTPPAEASQPGENSAQPSATPTDPAAILEAFLAKTSRERTDADLLQLVEHPELLAGITELDLRGGSVTDQGVQCLASFPDLQRVDLSETRITNQGLSLLTQCAQLSALALDHNRGFDTDGVQELTALNLQELSLQSTSIADRVFATLAEFDDLQVLRVDGNSILTGAQLRTLIGEFSELRVLSASGTQMAFGLQEIGVLRNLEELKLAQAQVGDEILLQLKQCRNLVELDLSNNPITILGVRELSALRNLQRLNLRGCSTLDDQVFATLGRLDQLQYVDLGGTRCTPAGAEAFQQRLGDVEVVLDDPDL